MIRIHLTNGDTVDTDQYTHDQALALYDAGKPLELGGIPDDFAVEEQLVPRRTVFPTGIAHIEELTA